MKITETGMMIQNLGTQSNNQDLIEYLELKAVRKDSLLSNFCTKFTLTS
jgi:hypothetical protein